MPLKHSRLAALLHQVGVCLALTTPIAGAADGAPPHGELAAAVRSAGQPCHHVIKVSAVDDRQWNVQCNAGSYLVVREDSGRLVLPSSGQ